MNGKPGRLDDDQETDMGWWQVGGSAAIEVGDAVLDQARHFLQSVSGEYQNDLRRKPTLDELQYLLTLAFSVNADSDVLAGFDELRIQKVILKTEKRKKRIKPEPGDIFSFKIERGLYGFGRLVFRLRGGTIAEIFDCTSRHPVFDYSKEGTRLIDPVLINDFTLLDRQTEGEWGVIAKNPAYEPGKEFDDVFFSWKDYQNNHKLEGVRQQGFITDEATASKYPRYVTVNDGEVRRRVLEALKKQAG